MSQERGGSRSPWRLRVAVRTPACALREGSWGGGTCWASELGHCDERLPRALSGSVGPGLHVGCL